MRNFISWKQTRINLKWVKDRRSLTALSSMKNTRMTKIPYMAKIPYGKSSVRRKFRTATNPYGENSVRRKILRRKFLRRKILRRKVLAPYSSCHAVCVNTRAVFTANFMGRTKLKCWRRMRFLDITLNNKNKFAKLFKTGQKKSDRRFRP